MDPCLADCDPDIHAHRWCIVTREWHPAVRPGQVRFRRASCECGLVATSLAAWWILDRLAFEQFVDPDGVQRAFCGAAGLRPRPEGVCR